MRGSVLTEIDEQSAVSLPLIRRQRQNARDVVIEEGVLFLEQNEDDRDSLIRSNHARIHGNLVP